MRKHILRRASGGVARSSSARREAEADRVARLTKELVDETGEHAQALIGLMSRRAPNVTASESLAFILDRWRSDGDDRERLIAHAAKDDKTIALERELSVEIQKVMRPFAGRPLTFEREKEIKVALVRFMRARLPATNIAAIKDAAATSFSYSAERLSLHMDPLIALMRRELV